VSNWEEVINKDQLLLAIFVTQNTKHAFSIANVANEHCLDSLWLFRNSCNTTQEITVGKTTLDDVVWLNLTLEDLKDIHSYWLHRRNLINSVPSKLFPLRHKLSDFFGPVSPVVNQTGRCWREFRVSKLVACELQSLKGFLKDHLKVLSNKFLVFVLLFLGLLVKTGLLQVSDL